MTIGTETETKLSITLQLPGVLLWVMAIPFAVFVLFGISEVLSGSVFGGLMLIVVFGGFGGWGLVRASERADLILDRENQTVRLVRRTLLGSRVEEFALANLDSAELSRNARRGSGAMELVFTNTRPATRVPVTGWGVSRGGMGPLVQQVNDWLAKTR